MPFTEEVLPMNLYIQRSRLLSGARISTRTTKQFLAAFTFVFILGALVFSAEPPKGKLVSDAKFIVYKEVDEVKLKLKIWTPLEHKPTDKRPTIVFIGAHGNFAPHCMYFASRGMIAAAGTVTGPNGIPGADANAQSAIRWVRGHAKELGADPDRIVVSGASLCGQFAASTGIVKDLTGDEDATVSFRPNAMILYCPSLDLIKGVTGDDLKKSEVKWKTKPGELEELSPIYQVKAGLPPMIIFHGKQDTHIPFERSERFGKLMRDAGNRCEVVGYEGAGHVLFDYKKIYDDKYFIDMLKLADRFLASMGYLKGEPTTDKLKNKNATGNPN